MTIEDAMKVLAKAAAVDQRTVGESDILAWSDILPEWIELVDALEAVSIHYRRQTRRIMPADLIQGAKEARARRLGYMMVEEY